MQVKQLLTLFKNMLTLCRAQCVSIVWIGLQRHIFKMNHYENNKAPGMTKWSLFKRQDKVINQLTNGEL